VGGAQAAPRRYPSGNVTSPGGGPRTAPPSRPPENIFGEDPYGEKSLDDVILAYLAEDLADQK
jgi:hypothetical protein